MMTADTILKAMTNAIESGDCNCPECCAKNGFAALGKIAVVLPREPDPRMLTEAWSEIVRSLDSASGGAR